MPEDFYRDLAPIYDRMIDWNSRLRREAPWFEDLWRRTGARRVLDAACGSGGHLPLWASQGLEAVVGADASEAMLALARERVAALPPSGRPRLLQATWAELPERLPETFDAVLCLGNSLPYVTGDEELRAALSGLWPRVAPGGLLLLQYKNFARRREGEGRFLPLSSHQTADGSEDVIVRLYDWEGERVIFNVMALHRDAAGAPWSLRQHATPLRPWRPDRVTGELCALGARVRQFGSLDLKPFDPVLSEDVVLWASKKPEA